MLAHDFTLPMVADGELTSCSVACIWWNDVQEVSIKLTVDASRGGNNGIKKSQSF